MMNAHAAPQPEIDTCHACGKFFPRVYVQLCGDCSRVEENRFQLVKEFLLDNAGSSINLIADATGLARGEVARFYAEGRLVEIDPGFHGQQDFCTCSVEGRRCGHCRSKLARQLNQTSSSIGSTPTGPTAPGPLHPGAPSGTLGESGATGWRGNPQQKKRLNPDEHHDRVKYIRRAKRENEDV